LAKIKIDFFALFGVGGAGWRCRSFFFLNTAIGFFFFYIFYRVKFGTFFFDDLTKSTLLAGGNSKSYGNFEILKFDRRTVGSAAVYTRDRPGAWSDGFGRNSA
jgi:hypothetical protein